MGKLVVLRLDGEALEQGCHVTLQIEEEGKDAAAHTVVEMTGYLPPAPELTTYLQHHWQQKYRCLGAPYRIEPIGITYGGSVNQQRISECKESAEELRSRFTAWLDSELFRPIDRCLREELNHNEAIRFLIRTDNKHLQKLPWHLWDLIERYPNAEVALSSTKSRQIHQSPKILKTKIKILAILGHSAGIDIEADRKLLENLPHTETIFLVEPKHYQINDQLWEQDWDIIFFAGHSETQGETGRIYINPTDSLTVDELWYALKKAVERGLKLAIFNSCDGLGLAKRLNDLHIPQMIVMRELVPDQVAQTFLKHLLTALADGKSLYLATREARERLQGLESQYPCASWLPVICQNFVQEELIWERLLKKSPSQSNPTQHWLWRLRTLLLASVVVTSFVVGMRSLGLFESVELKAFDQLMRLRPKEEPDKRLLLIAIDEKDVQAQPLHERGAASLSDRTLAQVLAKLEQYQPRAIGLDIYRETPVSKDYPDLRTRMQRNSSASRFIAICKYGNPGVSPPPDISPEGQGFNNVLLDSDDILRRHLLAVGSASPCQTEYSFSLQLAMRYLADEKVELKTTLEDNLQLGTIVFPTLEKNTAGYHQIDARGHQVLLNYRASHPIAKTVTLTDVLSDRFDPNLVRNRIVLIGTTAPSFNDHRWRTPYSEGKGSIQNLTGVEIQAHMVSQILSAVLEHRPLIGWWPKQGEVIWIWCWSFVGGLVAWRVQSPLRLVMYTVVALGILYGSCLGLLILKGSWLPLVPCAIALVITGASVVIYFLSPIKNSFEKPNRL